MFIAIKKDEKVKNFVLCKEENAHAYREKGYTLLDENDIKQIRELAGNDYYVDRSLHRYSTDEITDFVCQQMNVTRDAVMSETREKDVVVARCIIFYILRFVCCRQLKEIGKSFNKNHATVIHSLKTIENMITTKDTFYYELIKTSIEHFDEKLFKRITDGYRIKINREVLD